MEQDQPFDDRAEAYLKSGDLVVAIARSHHKLTIDETTHQRWRQLMGLMREVDTWLDNSSVTADTVASELATFELFDDRYPALSPEAVGNVTHRRMVDRAKQIFDLGGQAAHTTNIAEYIELRIGEAVQTVNLFDDTASRQVIEQPAFRRDFLPTVRGLGAAATLFDSIIDARQDVRQGKQQLQPDWHYYWQVTKAMAEQGRGNLRSLAHVAPLFHSTVKIGQRVVNRLRHGRTDYSTLSLFRK